MNKIQNNTGLQTPWAQNTDNTTAPVSRALTAETNALAMEQDVAPMMAELLARLEPQDENPTDPLLAPPSMQDPWRQNPEKALRDVAKLCTTLTTHIQSLGDSDEARRLNALVQTLEDHLATRREIMMRAGSGR